MAIPEHFLALIQMETMWGLSGTLLQARSRSSIRFHSSRVTAKLGEFLAQLSA